MKRSAQYNQLITELVRIRRATGMNQTEVAELMHVSSAHVSMIECGKRGRTLAVLEAYADAVGAELIAQPRWPAVRLAAEQAS